MKLNKNGILEDFFTMIRMKTVSCPDGERTDREEFRRLRSFIRKRYAILFEKGEGWQIGDYGILIHIPGKSSKAPSVLMAHMDVVPADGSGWTHEPFGAEYAEGRIYGRGTLDTKCTLCAVLTAMEHLLKEGFVPEQDIYLSFGGEEEISGETASQIAAFLDQMGVKPAFVLDEGGSVIPEGLPGVKRPAAMIGISEKGTANYMLSIRNEAGGHASVPPKSTVIGRLAKAAVAIESHPFPARLTGSVKLMFRELSEYAPFYGKLLFKHPEMAEPALTAAASLLGGTFNAMVRTTAAVTIMEGRSSFNVLPDSAAMGVNVRILEGDTLDGVSERLRKLADDPGIQVELISGSEPTPVSDIHCREYRILKETIRQTWPGCVTAPYQMNGGTDSRFFCGLTDHIFRFSPMVMTKEERNSVHGKNESIAAGTLFRMIVFYIRLIRKL